MHIHTGCSCWAFPHCVISNAYQEKMKPSRKSCTGCICEAFLHCVFSNASSDNLPWRKNSHIFCIGSFLCHSLNYFLISPHEDHPERYHFLQNFALSCSKHCLSYFTSEVRLVISNWITENVNIWINYIHTKKSCDFQLIVQNSLFFATSAISGAGLIFHRYSQRDCIEWSLSREC